MPNQKLIQEAIQVINPKTINNAGMGGVACALITDKNTIFKGVCIDTISGMGFCAEHTAISQMIIQGEYVIKKIVAVKKDDEGNVFILSPCGRCREFMHQTNKLNLEADVVLGKDKVVKLKELLPFHGYKHQI